MQIYELLKQDHDKLKAMLNELMLMDDGDSRHIELVDQIRDLLVPHSRAEEKVFYNSLRVLNADNAKLLHSYKEHAEAETLLRSIQVEDKLKANWKDTARKLKEGLEHHIQEEENVIFNIARSMLSEEEATRIGVAFTELKPKIEQQGIMKTSFELISNLMPPRFKKSLLGEHRDVPKH